MLTDDVRATREKIRRRPFRDEVSQRWDDVLSTFPHPRYELIPTGVVHDGDAEVRQYYRDTRVAFPDQRHEMIALRHSDDAVICESTFYRGCAPARRGMPLVGRVGGAPVGGVRP